MNESLFLARYIRSFFEDHLVCHRNLSRNTIRSYRDAIKLLLTFTVRTLSKPTTTLLTTDVDEDLVIAFLTDLEDIRGNSIQTRNYRLAAIKSLFEYIASREPLLLDHCRRITFIPRKRGEVRPVVTYLEREQVTAILEAPDRNTPLGRRDHALLLFLYNTGARVQEVADARESRVSFSRPQKVQLLGKGRKWRTCPLWDSTVDHLRSTLDERTADSPDSDFLFVNRNGRQLSRSGIETIVQRHVASVAESTPGLRSIHVSPHTFRHTTAMHLLQSGVEINVIRSWLGHASLTTTNRYVEIDLAMKAKALDLCQIGEHPTSSPRWQSDPNIMTWLESL